MNYSHTAITIEGQIELLRSRGLQISDTSDSKEKLACVSYFRLACYLKHFETDDFHNYIDGTSFEQIITLYNFDAELRILIFNTLQAIEVSLRTKMIQQISAAYGAHWFMDSSLFRDATIHQDCLRNLQRELSRSNEEYISDYYARYSSPSMPPAWKTLEVASFGTLSKLYCNFTDSRVKTAVAREFGLPHYKFLESWIKSATVLRNCCAHHSRVWNRRYAVIPMLPPSLPNPWVSFISIPPRRNKIYWQFCYLAYMDNSLSLNSNLTEKLKQLLNRHPEIDMSAMGFPRDWSTEPLWH